MSPEDAPASVSPAAPASPVESGVPGPVSPGEVFASGPTGHRAVDAALRSLENAAELPEAERIAAYEAAHRTLRETLSTIDDA